MDYEAKARALWDKLFLDHRNSDYPVHVAIIATAIREAVEEDSELLNAEIVKLRGILDALYERLEKRWDRFAWGDDYEMLQLIDPDYSWPRALTGEKQGRAGI